MGTVKRFLSSCCLGVFLLSCSGVTSRMNRRAESHVRFHASRQLHCEEAQLSASCSQQYATGECYQYEVIGCDAAIVYRNLNGSGWTPGE